MSNTGGFIEAGGFASRSEERRHRLVAERLERVDSEERLELARDHKIETYHVFWDNGTQTELCRGTPEEIEEMADTFGGGTYNIYPCIVGYKIKEVVPRTKVTGLHVWYIEDPETFIP